MAVKSWTLSIQRLNRFTYLPETQAPELFKQALAINVAVFTVSSTQARVFELFLNLEHSIRKTPRYGLRYLPMMTPTEGRPDQEKRYGILQSYARCILWMGQIYYVQLLHMASTNSPRSPDLRIPLQLHSIHVGAPLNE